MKSKKEQKATKQTKNGKKPVIPPAATTKPASESKRTIKQVIIETINANNAATNEEMIAAVKTEFPKSAFNDNHASWYRSQARKGLLTGAPIAIPPAGRKQSKTAD